MDREFPRTGRVLVTGAAGFVARRLTHLLLEMDVPVNAAVRGVRPLPEGDGGKAPDWISVGDIDGRTNWSQALSGCDAVVHLAARAHKVRDKGAAAEEDYRRVNVDATLRLAEQAADAGVRRFVFISSIGVMGESSRQPLTETDPIAPVSEYAKSKALAEQSLWRLTERMVMELVVLRPVLVYGPGNPGNLDRLLGLIGRRFPLPLANVRNLRSLVSVDYLADAIRRSMTHPQAANQLFLVADGVDVSTPDIIRAMARGMQRSDPLLRCPPWALGLLARLFGKGRELKKIAGTLQVDSTKLRDRLGMAPNLAVLDNLSMLGACYAASKQVKRGGGG